MNHLKLIRYSVLLVCCSSLVYFSIYNFEPFLKGYQSVKKISVDMYKDVLSNVYHDISVTSDEHIEYRDNEYFEYKKCLLQKSIINKRKNLRTPEKLAKYNCTHLMTLPNSHLSLSQLGNGRFGNKMFQVASLIGVATWHGYTPVLNHAFYLINMFELTDRINFSIENVDAVREDLCCARNEQFYNLDHSKNWTMVGWLQSFKYFQGVERRLRKAFTFRQKFKVRIMNYLQSLGMREVVNVGVHVRRGDVTNKPFTNLGYGTAPLSYIQRAMQFFRDKFKPDVRFILVSNDPKWCKDNFNGTDTHVSPFTDPILDMALLSSCNHTIITTGTFGWWGAWLANGITVFYADFPRSGSWLDTQFNKTDSYGDYYPHHWIGMR